MCRLRPPIFFPRVVPPGSAGLGRLDGLAVDDAGGGRRLAAGAGAGVAAQGGVDLRPQAAVAPGVEVVGHQAPGREVVGQQPPGAAGAGDVQGGVDDLAGRVGAGPAGAPLVRAEQVADVVPLEVA